MQRCKPLQLISALKVEPDGHRGAGGPGRHGRAAHLLAAHIRRVHRRIRVAKAAQGPTERLEARAKHAHIRRARVHAAAWAHTNHLLGSVVRKHHAAATVLLPVHGHLDHHIRRGKL